MTTSSQQPDLTVSDFITRGPAPVPRLYGEALVRAAIDDPRIVCLCADLPGSTETDLFRDQLPDRFIEAGIAEANMIGMAAGMARCGDVPFVHSFGVFVSRRCFDQIANQVAYPRLPVKIAGFLPGLTTMLGVSHQAIDDVAMLRALPNMTIIEPAGPEQLAGAVAAALAVDGPVYLRLKRPESAIADLKSRPIPIDEPGELLREGSDGTIFASGILVGEALKASRMLAQQNRSVAVVAITRLKPLDAEFVLRHCKTGSVVVTAENHSVIGGLGSAVAEILLEGGASVGFARVGVRDTFAEGGSTSYLQAKYGLLAGDIVAAFERAAARRTTV